MGHFALENFAGVLPAVATVPMLGRGAGTPSYLGEPYVREIERAPLSGLAALDDAMRELARALHGTNRGAARHAAGDVLAVCVRLKLWENYDLVT